MAKELLESYYYLPVLFKQAKMKRLPAILTIAVILTSCGSGNSEATTGGPDSVKKAFDSVQQAGDTTALNQVMGDTTSASGLHGGGSGSRVGGGSTGGPQKKGGK